MFLAAPLIGDSSNAAFSEYIVSEITIKALTPELIEDYFDFFDNRAFSDGSPYYPCYCNAFK